MNDLNSPELLFALDAVRQASRLVKHIQAEIVSPALSKDDRSPVTVADFAAQAFIGKMLMDAYPDDPLVGEEDSTALRTPEEAQALESVTHFVSGLIPGADSTSVCAWIDHGDADPAARFWTLDPIDGTRGFLRGQQYAVALALVVDGQVEIGVLGCPNLRDGYIFDLGGPGSLVYALHGRGTWTIPLEGEGEVVRLRVSSQRDVSQARLMRSFEAAHTNVGELDQIAGRMGVEAEPVRMDSQAKYAILAAGHGELLFRLLSPAQPDYREKIWDQAAGSLVLEEAGGRITDLHGLPLDFTAGRKLLHNRGVLASNGYLHDTALEALRTINTSEDT